MSKKIDERIPQSSGEGAYFKNYYGIQSPWNKIILIRRRFTMPAGLSRC